MLLQGHSQGGPGVPMTPLVLLKDILADEL